MSVVPGLGTAALLPDPPAKPAGIAVPLREGRGRGPGMLDPSLLPPPSVKAGDQRPQVAAAEDGRTRDQPGGGFIH